MNLSETKYLYKPRWKVILLGIIFFGACAAFMLYKAKTNDRGLIIDNLIELDTEQASVFFAVIGCLSAGFVLLAIGGIYMVLRDQHYLIVNEQELIIPPVMFGRKGYKVPLSGPFSLSETEVNGQTMLKITAAGKSRTIVQSMFESDSYYFEARAKLYAIQKQRSA